MATYIKFSFNFKKLGNISQSLYRIGGCISVQPSRSYTIEPPAWMGGKYRIELPDKYEFPNRMLSFQERMKELAENGDQGSQQSVNIGVEYSVPSVDRKTLLDVSINNRKNKELEQAARLDRLDLSVSDMRSEQMSRVGPAFIKRLADHYDIYHSLFPGSFFYPVVSLNVAYNNTDGETVSPVYYGNRILASECTVAPSVSFADMTRGAGEDGDGVKGKLWTLLMVSPDSHLTKADSEYVHWLVGNIEGDDIERGDTVVEYLQPIPAQGTGFHRIVYVLFEQKQKIDFSSARLTGGTLDSRTFSTQQFFTQHNQSLVPKGLTFHQTQWDESVRHAFHQTLDMEEPSYEYIHPPAYHPTPKKYPHKEPFNRYFDRYRDRKDLAEEVLRLRLSDSKPFEKRKAEEKYPLVGLHKSKTYKPSWLLHKEELMHRRVEQFKDLK